MSINQNQVTDTLVPSTGTLTITGNLSVSGTAPGGTSWQSVQTGNFSAVSGNAYPINTTSSAITVTLPASPSAGNYIVFTDYAGTWNTNLVTLNVNGKLFNGGSANVLLNQTRESIAIVYIDATQGWVPYSGFNAITPVSNYTISYLIVAGGGGGGGGGAGGANGGGGGAGGLLTGTSTLQIGTSYTVTVGAGGAGGSSSGLTGTNGNNSSATSQTATGGGGGAGSNGVNAASGGSGGGGGYISGFTAGGSGTSGQGNAGGTGKNYSTGAGTGGGGGAGAVGGNAGNNDPGPSGSGGAGTASSITGSSVTYAGGGGGAAFNGGGDQPGSGGSGGGGGGGAAGAAGTAGTANTGGGGGGSSANTGATGGSGVVILSIPTVSYSGVTTGSPTVTTNGSNKILTFTASGSYTA